MAQVWQAQPWSAQASQVPDEPQVRDVLREPDAPPDLSSPPERPPLLLGPKVVPPVPPISRRAQQVFQQAVRASLAKASRRGLAQPQDAQEQVVQQSLALPACSPQLDEHRPQAWDVRDSPKPVAAGSVLPAGVPVLELSSEECVAREPRPPRSAAARA